MTFSFRGNDDKEINKKISLGEFTTKSLGVDKIEINQASIKTTTSVDKATTNFTVNKLNPRPDYISVGDLQQNQIGVCFEYLKPDTTTTDTRDEKIKVSTTVLQEGQEATVTISGLTPNTIYEKANIVYKLKEKI